MRRIVYGAGFLMVLASLSTAVMAARKCPNQRRQSFHGARSARRRHSHAAGALRQEVVDAIDRQSGDVGDQRARSYRVGARHSVRERRDGSRGQRHHSFGRPGDPHGWDPDPAGADAP